MLDVSQVRTWLELTTGHGIASGNLVRDLAESWLALYEELAQVKASLGGKMGTLSEENYQLRAALEAVIKNESECDSACANYAYQALGGSR